MPPAEFRHKLTEAEIETIRRWITNGAQYESHWAWSRPTRPELPDVRDESWIQSPI
jgi:hypothetical protein